MRLFYLCVLTPHPQIHPLERSHLVTPPFSFTRGFTLTHLQVRQVPFVNTPLKPCFCPCRHSPCHKALIVFVFWTWKQCTRIPSTDIRAHTTFGCDEMEDRQVIVSTSLWDVWAPCWISAIKNYCTWDWSGTLLPVGVCSFLLFVFFFLTDLLVNQL